MRNKDVISGLPLAPLVARPWFAERPGVRCMMSEQAKRDARLDISFSTFATSSRYIRNLIGGEGRDRSAVHIGGTRFDISIPRVTLLLRTVPYRQLNHIVTVCEVESTGTKAPRVDKSSAMQPIITTRQLSIFTFPLTPQVFLDMS
ncbi:Protein of unknown function [Pyronema omphalodes CBS 100304]|uniref:Uncharacterized protein n=1 Tax=Pyronema omphalodes (strain CBS 100304) TaxID=1076935 RepID=U4KU28_PYROM|nr:Protein of unknown function [Pyronema omphalodes CBS 100304]